MGFRALTEAVVFKATATAAAAYRTKAIIAHDGKATQGPKSLIKASYAYGLAKGLTAAQSALQRAGRTDTIQ